MQKKGSTGTYTYVWSYVCVYKYKPQLPIHRDEHVSRRGSRLLRVGMLCLPTLPLARLGHRAIGDSLGGVGVGRD